jgi:beta-lactamase class A
MTSRTCSLSGVFPRLVAVFAVAVATATTLLADGQAPPSPPRSSEGASRAPAAPAGPVTDPALREAVTGLVASSGAEVGVAFRTLDGRDQLRLNADKVFHAASTMKIAVMIEMFRQAKLGFFKLDDKIPVVNTFRSIADGSPYTLSAEDDSDPDLYKAVGQLTTYRQLCELMITVSSNLATNILIERLKPEKIQQTIVDLGAYGMTVRRGVEDNVAYRAGLNNTTTAGSLLVLLDAIATGKAVSPEASKEMLEILKRQRFNDAIPAGLPAGTVVAHKTGSITRIQHDAAIVLGPRPYVLVVLVGGLDDEATSKTLIAAITRAVDGSLR